jgi:hypothetical protein
VVIHDLATATETVLTPPSLQVSKHYPRVAVSASSDRLAFCHVFERVFLYERGRGEWRLWTPDQPWPEGGDKGKRLREWTHFARRLWLSETGDQVGAAPLPLDKEDRSRMEVVLGSWNAPQGEHIAIPSARSAVDLCPRFERIAAFKPGNPNEIGVWNLRSGELVSAVSAAGPVSDLRFNATGALLAAAYSDRVTVYSVEAQR